MSKMKSYTSWLKMPDGQTIETIFINDGCDLIPHLARFWKNTMLNPMVAFDTEWKRGCIGRPLPRNTKAVIGFLKLCNLHNTCLVIDLEACYGQILDILPRFLAVNDIKFVGVNISKELQKLKEDHGLEIRNAIDLSVLAADHWNVLKNNVPCSALCGHYEEWRDYELRYPRGSYNRPSEKLSPPLCGVRLLSAFFVGMKIPYQFPSVSDEGELTYVDPGYHMVPVYAALKIGVELLTVRKVECMHN